MIKISVITPIYGVEKFIGRCVESLMQQTIDGVEYIFVNDATPDKSMDVLRSVVERYPVKASQVKIVEHEHNKGLPAARNSGMAVATGEYLFHCDSDDYVEPDMLETLYSKALEAGADIVWSDWYLTFEKNERYMAQPSYDTPMEALKAMLGGAMKYNVWNKLVKRSLYVDNGIEFPAGYGMGEDMTMMFLFAHARKVAYVPKAFYHYVKLNSGAFSQTYSDRHLEELKHNVQRTAEYLHSVVDGDIEKDLAFFKLEAQFPFLITDGSNGRYRLWQEWFPEANKYILSNKNISARSRMVQWLAWKRQWWLVRAYNFLLTKLVYGIIYK